MDAEELEKGSTKEATEEAKNAAALGRGTPQKVDNGKDGCVIA